MDEFQLIEVVIEALGERAAGGWVTLGPGDDATIVEQTPGCQAVASIDTLVCDVHFPAHIPAYALGYRALMVSLSDLAAMAATPRYVLVALTLPEADVLWVRELARGMAEAATRCNTYISGGNFTRGPLSITVSVHGEVPTGTAVTRAGAQQGDRIYVSGPLGAAAACARQQDFAFADDLSGGQHAYLFPNARVDLCSQLRACAHAAIDLSDGLTQDLTHLCSASGVQARLRSSQIPLGVGAELPDALYGGDDYELIVTSHQILDNLFEIGEICAGKGVYLDDQPLSAAGYNHFE